jgi:hypothetical protein
MVNRELLDEITAAAARCLPISQIDNAVGGNAWEAAVREDPEAIRLAVLTGRVQVQLKTAAALEECSAMGKTAASLFILQSNHGWPKPKIGRPRK